MNQTEVISSVQLCGLSNLEGSNLWISQWKSMACNGQNIWQHHGDASSVPTGHRQMKPSVSAHSRVHCCSTAQETPCKPCKPTRFCLCVYISWLETYKLSHEHKRVGSVTKQAVSVTFLSCWLTAEWYASIYIWSIRGGRRHRSETAAGITGLGQLLPEENRLQFQAEWLNFPLLIYRDFYFVYLYNLNNLFPKLVLLLCVTSCLHVPKHSLFPVNLL